MQPSNDVVKVDDADERISCDGGGGALGHPTVYFSLGADNKAECYYCGRQFVLAGSDADPDSAAAGARD